MISSITKDIIYVGVNDHDVDLFEGQYIVPNGMAYNSYVIMDERIAVMDTVDAHFGEEWLSNVKEALNGAGLSCGAAYGAGSFGKRGKLCCRISQCQDSWQRKNLRHDSGLF